MNTFFFHVDVGSESKFLIMRNLQNGDQAKMLLSILHHVQFSHFSIMIAPRHECVENHV